MYNFCSNHKQKTIKATFWMTLVAYNIFFYYIFVQILNVVLSLTNSQLEPLEFYLDGCPIIAWCIYLDKLLPNEQK